MHNTADAKRSLSALHNMRESLANSSTDDYGFDPYTTLAMCAQHAEILINMEEGNDKHALQMTEDFQPRYSAILSSPEFKSLAEEVATLRGFLLGNAGAWNDARRILENVTPPEAYKSLHSFYLGRSYYEDKEYARAKTKLAEAVSICCLEPAGTIRSSAMRPEKRDYSSRKAGP
jgi:hypothetical protein